MPKGRLEIVFMKTRKVGIIGLGHVGAHVAYSLAVQGICDELVLVDKNEKKVESERQDIADSAAYLPHRVHVSVGNFADLGDCDVIVNSVGKIELLETHDRLTEMDFTISAVNGFADNDVTIHLIGGDLQISWSGNESDSVFMTGGASTVFTGDVDLSKIK